jgi:hypothetical protein
LAHALYESLLPAVAGACNQCAVVFGAEGSGLPSVKDNEPAGTHGLASLRRYLVEDWQTVLF